MAKDGKGHGSEKKGWGHAQHFAESQRLRKTASAHEQAGDKRKATDARAAANEHAAQARHKLVSEKRRAEGSTPAQRMAAAKPSKGDTFKPRKR